MRPHQRTSLTYITQQLRFTEETCCWRCLCRIAFADSARATNRHAKSLLRCYQRKSARRRCCINDAVPKLANVSWKCHSEGIRGLSPCRRRRKTDFVPFFLDQQLILKGDLIRSHTTTELEFAFDKGLLESSWYKDPGFITPAPRRESLLALSGCTPGKAGNQLSKAQ